MKVNLFIKRNQQHRTLRRISNLVRIPCTGMVHVSKADKDGFALDLDSIAFNSLVRQRFTFFAMSHTWLVDPSSLPQKSFPRSVK